MLTVHTRNVGTLAICCLAGRLVVGETAALRIALESQPQVSAVVLDLAHVSTIDAGSLGLLLKLREQTTSRGIDFKLMNPTKLVSKVLEITRLNTVFEVTSGSEVLAATSIGRPTARVQLPLCATRISDCGFRIADFV